MKNEENLNLEGQKKFNFKLIKKFAFSFTLIFILFFAVIGLYTGQIIKEQILKNVKSPMQTLIIHEADIIETFFKNVENIGKNSVIFVKTLLKGDISQKEMDLFSNKYKLIDGAIRTDLKGFKTDDISAIFLSSKNKLTDEIRRMILQTEKGFSDYTKGILSNVLNMYFISIKNMIRVYHKDWVFKVRKDYTFDTEFFKNFQQNKHNKGIWINPYYDAILKKWITSYISPVYIGNEFIGTVGHDVILNRIYEKLLNLKIYNSGYFFVFNSDNKIIISPKYLSHLKKRAEMRTELDISISDNVELSKSIQNVIHDIKNKQISQVSFLEKNGEKNVLIAKKLNFLNWYIASVIPEDEILELFPKMRLGFIITSLSFLFILLIVIIFIIFYFIIRPIKKLTAVSAKIQQGDLGARSNIKTMDEIGELSFTFDKMTSKLEDSLEYLNRDLVIRKETDRALFESNEKFKKLFENSPDMISLSRKSDSKFVNLNLGFETLTGYLRKEAIETSALELDLWVNETQRDDMINIIDDKGFAKDFAFLLKRKDNKIRHCLVSAGQIELNSEPHLVSIIRDITEQEVSKKEKGVLEEKLEQSKKMEALGTLAGGVAHDLNNILSGLVSYPDLLLMKIPDDSPMKKPLTTIKESGKKAAAIVQDLLTLARRGVSTTNVVNLNSLINEYLESLEYKKLKSFHPDITVKKNLKDNLFNIIGSKVHLLKTLMNLIANAAESMQSGGEITISTKNQYIDCDIRRHEIIKEGNYSIIEVQDEGIGISSIDLERIFEPFYTKKKMGQSGTGLGMAVVWGTIKDHKGFIDINSVVGEGTTFTLYFPITNRELTRTDNEFDVNDYLGNGEKVLIIDDVLEQRELAYDILKRLGYSVDFVASGEHAIEYLKNTKVDLLLLDMIMEPGIDGLDTYRHILLENPNQKAIIVSGYSETERVAEAIKLGVSKYIKKPYSVENLSKSIKKVFSQKHEKKH